MSPIYSSLRDLPRLYLKSLLMDKAVKLTLMLLVATTTKPSPPLPFVSVWAQIDKKLWRGLPWTNASLLHWALLWLVLPLKRSVHFNAPRFLLKWMLYSNLLEIGWRVEELTVDVDAVLNRRAPEWQQDCCIALPQLLMHHDAVTLQGLTKTTQRPSVVWRPISHWSPIQSCIRWRLSSNDKSDFWNSLTRATFNTGFSSWDW